MRNLGEHVESRHSRHLDVEKHQIGRVRTNRGQCLATVRALRDDLEISSLFQAQLDSPASQCLVVHDDGADLHARTASIPGLLGAAAAAASVGATSKGNAISTRSPGRLFMIEKRWWVP